MKALLILSLIALSLSAETIIYYTKCASSYTSIVDALTSIGVNSSFDNRKKIAALNGISNYAGTASENTGLLTLLKSGKLIKSKTSSTSDDSPTDPTTPAITTMMNRIKSNTSLSLSNSKKNSLVSMGTVLLNDGFKPAFVAGILGNIIHEGSVGLFESSNYKSNPSAKPKYLRYMDENYSYATKYSGKYITEVSLNDLNTLMKTLAANNWEKGKFGLGTVQWTGGRTYTLVKLYNSYCNNKDSITLEQATKAEAKMIGNEINGGYNYIYTSWLNDNKNSLDSETAAYNAGSIICKKYEVPADYENKAITRGNTSKKVYKVMMGL